MKLASRRARILARASLASLLIAAAGTGARAQVAARPKLIIAIAVDQLSADLFAQYRQSYKFGLKRLADAVVFPSGYQSHAATETCPGHATILTGSHPARTGIVGNQWIDHAVSRGSDGSHNVYCAEDESVPGTSSQAGRYVVSPVHLRVPTLGDRMKHADPRSRVVSVAGKDRAAVMLGGHRSDQIWYFDPGETAAFVTLPGRTGPTPSTVREVNARVKNQIKNGVPRTRNKSCDRMASEDSAGTLKMGAPADSKSQFRISSGFDKATADLSIGLLRSMRLGRGAAPDLLAIGLSATDYVGHAFGTAGEQMCHQQVALDRAIASILAAADETGVPYAVVLTADHGGFDVPERHVQRSGFGAGRLDGKFSIEAIGTELAREFGLNDSRKLLEGEVPGDVYLSPTVPSSLRRKVLAAAKSKFLRNAQVQQVFTADELASASPPNLPVEDWSLLDRARASFDEKRSGDLLVYLRPRLIPDPPKPGSATTHGSPWDYDRRVPILFSFPSMKPFEQPLPIEVVDILPTLASMIGLEIPSGEIDGRCIDLDPGSGSTCL